MNQLPEFGDYVKIAQKRYGVPNEMYTHKVVGTLRSNAWVEVPVQTPAKEVPHVGSLEDVALCICCGVDETEVRRYRLKDLELMPRKVRTKNQIPDLRAELLKASDYIHNHKDDWKDPQVPIDKLRENQHRIHTLEWVLGEHERFD